MKSEIDDILNSMFRGGKLQFKSPQPERGKSAQAGKELQESVQRLAKETQAELAELEAHLAKDGAVRQVSAGNAGNPKDIEAAFIKAERETGGKVIGQEKFLSALAVALKRPFIAGTAQDAPLCRAALLGKPGTGRHTALDVMTASLFRQGVLKSPKIAFLDLGRYASPGDEKLFFQDLYAALKSGACALVFEHFEKCHSSVLSLTAELFQTGNVPLPGRYAEQKGMLVDVGSALVPGVVSTLSAQGKYLFLLTDQREARLADAFGMPFLSALDDICETGEFPPQALEKIAEGALKELGERARQRLGISLSWGASEVRALADACRSEQGAAAIVEEADRLYRLISEEKLKNGLESPNGRIVAKEEGLFVECVSKGEKRALHLETDGGEAARQAGIQAVKQELSEIVGLEAVKEYILSLEDNFTIQRLRREKGLKADSPSMHMIFTGNPGTGKTTVARIVSRYLKAIGVLSGGQLVEVTRADLVGQYVGHTAPLTNRAIQSALGGVLFIDEAYSLYRGKDDSFGLEAIDTLVKGMEDHRDSLLVILAGYTREMEEFLTANSGLRSRFPNVIEFPDYTAQELLDITKSIVKGKGYQLDPACEVSLLAYYEKMQSGEDARTKGNGRMARNKVEEAVIACSRRNIRTPEEQRNLELLLPEDFGFSQIGP